VDYNEFYFSKEIANSILLEGEDDFLVTSAIKKIKNAFNIEDLDISKFSGQDSVASISTSLDTIPFLSQKRLVIISEFYPKAKEIPNLKVGEDTILLICNKSKNDALKKIFSTYKMKVPAPDGGVRILVNHNRLLKSIDGCIGVKTGYTKSNGRCLVSAAERNGLRLIAVTLDDGNDWHDHTEMLEAGFSAYERNELCKYANIALPEIPLTDAEQSCVKTEFAESVYFTIPKSGAKITCIIETIPFLPAPVARGQDAGEIVFFYGETEIARVKLVTAYSAAKKKEKGFWEKLFG